MTKKSTILSFESLENKQVLSIVAILDSGLDINHKELVDNVWVNSKEIVNNNIDDDNNGYVDDIHGWNFISNNNNVNDIYGHGTHVSGIVQGVNANVQLLTIKMISDGGVGSTSALLNGLNYIIALKNTGVDIGTINCSWTMGTYGSTVVMSKLQMLRDLGVVVVCAAGNSATNLDITPYYPVSFKLENIVGVSSIMPDGKLSGSSNYGLNTVDVATYGTLIYSTWPGNRYVSLSGTSMAAPFISGKMSLLNGTVSERVFSLYDSVTKTPYLSDKVSSGGFLNVNTKFINTPIAPPQTIVPEQPTSGIIIRAGLYNVRGYVNKNAVVMVYVNNRFVGRATVVYNVNNDRYEFTKVLGRRYFHRGWNSVSIRDYASKTVLSSKMVRRLV